MNQRLQPNKLVTLLLLLSALLLPIGSSVYSADDPPAPPAMGARQVDPNAPQERDLNNLTDRDRFNMENYVHEGYLQREVDEKCKGIEAACQGREGRKKFMGMNPAMVKTLSKMYAMFMGPGGGDLKLKKPDENGKKSTSDKCKYIPMATEMISMANQSSKQNEIQGTPINPGSVQKEKLYQAARSHEARADTAKMQTYGWGGTTACYAAMMTVGGVAADTSTIIKVGAAGLLTAFYKQQWDAHQEYHDKVMAIADQLSGKGACNPVSEPNCYCAQPETINDAEYCLPQAAQRSRMANGGKVYMNCIDRKLKQDEDCSCLATESCYDTEFMQIMGGMGAGGAMAPYTIKPIRDLSRGSLGTGGLSNSTANGQSARAKRIVKDLANKLPFNKSLTPAQRKSAQALASRFGAPAALAAHIASMPMTAGAQKAMAKMQSASQPPQNTLSSSSSEGKMLYFGGKGIKKRRKKSAGFNYKKFLKKGKRGRRSGKVLTFAAKARNRASINRNSNAHIFKIISHRYNVSARRLLGITPK
jgi:hypothetical protein